MGGQKMNGLRENEEWKHTLKADGYYLIELTERRWESKGEC